MSGHNKAGSKISSASVPRVPCVLADICFLLAGQAGDGGSEDRKKEDRRDLPLRSILGFAWLSVNAESIWAYADPHLWGTALLT